MDGTESDHGDEDDENEGPDASFSTRTLQLLAAHEGAIRVLRWAAAIAFLVWLLWS